MWKRRLTTILGWTVSAIGIVWIVLPVPFGFLVAAAGLTMVCMNSITSRRWLRRTVERYPWLRPPLKRLPGLAGRIWLVGKERQLARAERQRLRTFAKARERAARDGGLKP